MGLKRVSSANILTKWTMESASHSWDSEFSTCIIAIDTCIIYHRSPMSTESILGSPPCIFSLCFVGLLIYFTTQFPTLFYFSRLLCLRPLTVGPFSFLLAPSRVGQSQLLTFVRSRATLKISYLLRKAYQHVKSASASPNTLVFLIWKLSVGASSDPSR